MGEIKLKYGVRDGLTWIHPVDSTYISSGFGYRWHPITGKWSMHRGTDLPMTQGSPIRASRSGKVTIATYHETSGNYVMLNHGDGYKSVYMHMTNYIVKVGQEVVAGQIIGYVGSTGSSTNPHLHFGICVEASYSHLLSAISDNDKHQKESGKDIYANPVLFTRFNGGYEEGLISDIPGYQSPTIWVDKEIPTHEDWAPLFPDSNYRVSNNGQRSDLFRRRRYLMANSSKVLFEGGKVNQEIGLGYNFVGINSHHPTAVGGATVPGSDDIVTREYINNYISMTPSGRKRGELSPDNQDKVAAFILSYLCNYPDETRKWTPNAVIGMLGNMVGESGLNPARWEGDKDRSINNERGISKGFGIVQWTPWNKHWDWCKENDRNYDPYDIVGQLEHIQDEFFGSKGQYYVLTNPHYVVGYYNQFSRDSFYSGDIRTYIDNNYYSSTPRIVPLTVSQYPKSDLSPDILAICFATNYERPAIKYIHADRRVENAKRFMGLFGANHYESRVVIPGTPTEATDNWVGLDITYNGVKGINPYLNKDSKHISTGKGYINNAYAWGRSVEILLSYMEKGDIPQTLCASHDKCWFEYNKKHNFYEYDKMPRVGSIICWEDKNHTSKSETEKSYIGVVEEVLGSDVIKISKMSIDNTSSDKFSCEVITNENNNWGMNKSKYIFKGFIHILPQIIFYPNISLSEDNNLHISCSSTTGEAYSSVLFGLKDIKHFNKMKIIYDLKIGPPKDGQSKILDENDHDSNIITRLDKLDDFCNFYIYMSQQVVSCEPSTGLINKNWPGTYFPELESKDDTNIGDEPKRNMGYPCPDGMVLLSSYSESDLTKKSKYNPLDGEYVFTDMSKTIQLNRCTYNGNYITVFGNDSQIRKFNRELPTYIGVTVKSSPAEFDATRYETSSTVIIKKIILYG